MLDDVTKRLESFGYFTNLNDSWVIDYIIKKIENHIKNQCNTNTVPDGLHQIAVDMVVGEFLLGKKSTGQLTEVDIEPVVKQLQEGDTNITFDITATPEKRLDMLIQYLLHAEADFAHYRCIKW